MKKILIIFILFGIFSSSFADNTFTIETENFINTKIQFQYDKIINFLIKKINLVYPKLSLQGKQNISNEIQNISNNFYLLERSVSENDRRSATIYITNIKNSYKNITNIIKDSSFFVEAKNTKSYITYYADYFEGEQTANGNIFSQDFFSAAKCEIPFNILMQVMSNYKSVIVKVNDRPNCYKYPDLIDLSTTAFDFLGKRYTGKKESEYLELGKVDKDYYKKYLSLDSFKDYGIILKENTPNTYFVNEGISIKGSSLLDLSNYKFILTDPTGEKQYFNVKINSDKQFFLYFVPKIIGKYWLEIEDSNISSSNSEQIYILDKSLFDGKKLIEDNSIQALGQLDIKIEDSNTGDVGFRISIPGNNYNEVKISQGNQIVEFSTIGDVIIPKSLLQNFDLSKNIEVTISSSKTETGFSHDAYTIPKEIFRGSHIFGN